MYKIQIIGRGKEFVIWVFAPNGTHLINYSVANLTAIQAYVYVRGLVKVFNAVIEGETSINAWQYILAVTNAEGNKN